MVAGVAVVTIPASEYAELVRCRALLKKKSGKLIPRRERPSRIDQDPEMAAFVRERLTVNAYNQTIAQECLEKFGKDRAPSKSAVHRFRMRERERLTLGLSSSPA
jgi:hypothetical protein